MCVCDEEGPEQARRNTATRTHLALQHLIYGLESQRLLLQPDEQRWG